MRTSAVKPHADRSESEEGESESTCQRALACLPFSWRVGPGSKVKAQACLELLILSLSSRLSSLPPPAFSSAPSWTRPLLCATRSLPPSNSSLLGLVCCLYSASSLRLIIYSLLSLPAELLRRGGRVAACLEHQIRPPARLLESTSSLRIFYLLRWSARGVRQIYTFVFKVSSWGLLRLELERLPEIFRSLAFKTICSKTRECSSSLHSLSSATLIEHCSLTIEKIPVRD